MLRPCDMAPYTEMCTEVFKKVADNHHKADAYERAMRRALTELELATQQYIEAGVALINNDNSHCFRRLEIKPKSYFYKVARKLGRPFVFAYDNGWEPVELRIDKSTRTENLAAGFLLTAVSYASQYQAKSHRSIEPISKHDRDGYWEFFLHGDEGRELLKMFLEQCKTNPVNRIILKLPPR